MSSLLLITLLLGQTTEPPSFALRSPDGRIVVMIEVAESGNGKAITWSARVADRPVLEHCGIGLRFADGRDPCADFEIGVVERSEHARTLPVSFGKASQVRDEARELRLELSSEGTPSMALRFRCYDDAIAFRYEWNESVDGGPLRIAEERTSFGLVGAPTVYASFLEHFRTSHEHPVRELSLAELPVGQLLDTPLTVLHADGLCLALTEAALLGYAGMSLRRESDGGPLVAALSPRDDGLAVVRTPPFTSPWRVVLIGAQPGALLESSTIYALNPAPEFDPSWIRPGKMTWPWWNHYLFDEVPAEPVLSFATSKRHIDWCAENGIDFHAIVADESDTPWYRQSRRGLFPGPDTDPTQVREDLDLETIHAYATKRGVRLWTWVHHAAIRGRVEESFAAFQRLGWSGIMVDFLDRDDQDTVEFAEEVLRAAARHEVLVHFHGMYKPTGWQRTFPHLMNHEGSLNLEYLKWTALCTPEHTLRVAFTRMLAGPMDYHLGGFRAVSRAEFAPQNVAPTVLGTRSHQLAMYLCLDNPAPMVADYPAAYRDQPGFDFLREVPTWWDETRVLEAEIGRLLVTARRKGGDWWIGGLAAGAERELEVPLDCLGEGEFSLRLWCDSEDVARDPNLLTAEARAIRSSEILRVRLGADGGFVARFTRTD